MAIETSEDEGEFLGGGSMGGAVRIGTTARRTAGPWSSTVQRLLARLRAAGLDWVPEPLGVDDRGRDVVSYLPGTTVQYPLPGWVWSDELMITVATRLEQFHQATLDLDRTDAVWQFAGHEPSEVICHNDVAPYNMVFTDDHRFAGLIDWDTAAPGPRVHDLAYVAYRFVPLVDPSNPDGVPGSIEERRRRLRLLCDTYGHDQQPAAVLRRVAQRLSELAEFTAARAAAGQVELAGHVELYRTDSAWVSAHLAALSQD